MKYFVSKRLLYRASKCRSLKIGVSCSDERLKSPCNLIIILGNRAFCLLVVGNNILISSFTYQRSYYPDFSNKDDPWLVGKIF